MVRRVRVRFPDAGNDWLIDIADETDRKSLVVLPAGMFYSSRHGYDGPPDCR